MTRVYNFGAGPATLPEAVLLRAQRELLDWQCTGVSVMEIGHRTPTFQAMLDQLSKKIRKLMMVPDNYKILFMQGGGQGSFSLIPMNLTKYNQNVDYLVSGSWSDRAAKYASRYAQVNIATRGSLSSVPDIDSWKLNPKAAYAYYCHNESINGIRIGLTPRTGTVPLISDVTSSILSEVLDVSQFGLLFAAAQKNLGITGITLVIIRDDLLEQALDSVPEVFNYKTQVEQNSCLNTIPTFPVYMMDLMVDWMNEQGTLAQIDLENQQKCAKLYQCIDQSKYYSNLIEKPYRSRTNIPFNLPRDDLLQIFLKEASDAGLKYLKGHASVGGARASLYNAMPMAGVDKLINFMHEFAHNHA